MHSLQATDDLIIEVYPADDDATGDVPLIKLRCLAMESDDPTSGSIIIWPEEIRSLIDCLATAAGLLAQEAANSAAETTKEHQ
jgi:hypothetical protein